ncbi:MAG TPA: serpin family protein [Acidimicrobiia bacterium]|nr:serpin family protein [Acidimicrobiia bacterium]
MRARLLLSLLALAACTTSAAHDELPGVEVSRSDVAFTPSASASDLAAVVAADTAFALDLVSAAGTDHNLIVSPFSIATALGMLEPGARGATRAEMATVLHETLVDEQLHPARGALLAALADQPAVSEELPPPFTLRAHNMVWAQRDYPILGPYLDVLAASYDAGLARLDFGSDPDAARITINDAVAEQTEQRIEDLIPEGVITDLTRLVLTNAVYFRANWLNEFDPEQTSDGVFHTASGSEVTVPMMSISALFDYADGDGYAAARLPYVGDASMMVLLPDLDLPDLIERLTVEEITAARERAASFQVDLTMPRFEFRTQLGLADVLQALGMRSAFVPPPGPGSADLTGIVETPELFVQDVVHQGFVAVDEKGTEAAAATAVIAGATSMPPTATLILDRPFLFLIQHDATGEILFAGVVADPAT